jgi:hypothetical protein
MLAALHKVATRNVGEVERILRGYLHQRDELEPVSRAELARRMEEGQVDVRPKDEFALGHLPGAHSVPSGELKHHLAKLDRKRRRAYRSKRFRASSGNAFVPVPALDSLLDRAFYPKPRNTFREAL